MDLDPFRAGVAMTWHSLDERERMVALYVLATVALWLFGTVQRRSRESLRAEIVEELAARGAGSRD